MTWAIRYVGENDSGLISKWGDFVREKRLPPQACYEWISHLVSVFDMCPFALLVVNDNHEVGGFALLYFVKGEKVLYSGRYGFYAQNEEVALLLQGGIQTICCKYGLSETVITSGGLSLDIIGSMSTRDSLHLPLIYDTLEDLWLSIPKKTKNMVRKAEKSGCVVTKDWAYLEEFYDIYTRRFMEKSLSLKPLEHFHDLKEMFGDRAVFIGALENGELIAGMIFISTGKIASYVHNASILNALNNGINNLLMWEAMKVFYAEQVEYIDLSESQFDSPVFKFKKRLSKDVEIRKTYYYNVLNNAQTSGSSKVFVRLMFFLRNKVLGVCYRTLPVMPLALKKRYLLFSGRRGRVL